LSVVAGGEFFVCRGEGRIVGFEFNIGLAELLNLAGDCAGIGALILTLPSQTSVYCLQLVQIALGSGEFIFGFSAGGECNVGFSPQVGIFAPGLGQQGIKFSSSLRCRCQCFASHLKSLTTRLSEGAATTKSPEVCYL
jgi:hypothetical protein